MVECCECDLMFHIRCVSESPLIKQGGEDEFYDQYQRLPDYTQETDKIELKMIKKSLLMYYKCEQCQ